MSEMLEKISGIVWGNGLIFLLLATGVYYTIKLRFIQLRMLPMLMKKNSEKVSDDGLSQLKTFCMSLGTAMGTGNITGIASAIAIGGPGAVFWMWVSAFFGMAVVYAENTLGARYRTGSCKGSIAYIRNGLGSRGLAAAFAVFCIFAALGMGGMVQVNSFAESIPGCTNMGKIIIAAASFVLIFSVTGGGASRIGSTAQFLLPLVTLGYSAAALAVIVKHSYNIIPVFSEIITDAFSFQPIAGGVGGFVVSRAVSAGIRRGIFSNEAGLGSSPLLHSAASGSVMKTQGTWSMLEVFVDTFVCCTLTALVILTSRKESINAVFATVFGALSSPFLTVSLGILAFCTVIGWYFCGESAFAYVFGDGHKRIFTLIFSVTAASGAVISASDVWTLSDIFNGLMAFPNILALLLLSKKVGKE